MLAAIYWMEVSRMTKRDVLAQTTFGERIAEDEAETLISYFVETDQWRKLLSGSVDIVYGPSRISGRQAETLQAQRSAV